MDDNTPSWAEEFRALLDRIQARVPPDISEAEVLRDVAEAVMNSKPKTQNSKPSYDPPANCE